MSIISINVWVSSQVLLFISIGGSAQMNNNGEAATDTMKIAFFQLTLM